MTPRILFVQGPPSRLVVAHSWCIGSISKCFFNLNPSLGFEGRLAFGPCYFINFNVDLILVEVLVHRIIHLLFSDSHMQRKFLVQFIFFNFDHFGFNLSLKNLISNLLMCQFIFLRSTAGLCHTLHLATPRNTGTWRHGLGPFLIETTNPTTTKLGSWLRYLIIYILAEKVHIASLISIWLWIPWCF